MDERMKKKNVFEKVAAAVIPKPSSSSIQTTRRFMKTDRAALATSVFPDDAVVIGDSLR
jgi:hypothetical protein